MLCGAVCVPSPYFLEKLINMEVFALSMPEADTKRGDTTRYFLLILSTVFFFLIFRWGGGGVNYCVKKGKNKRFQVEKRIKNLAEGQMVPVVT